jgi:hypothetical protein
MNENAEVWDMWVVENLDQSEASRVSDFRYKTYLQWLPEEVLIDLLEIKDVCRLGDIFYFGVWSKPNPLKDLWYFELKEPIKSYIAPFGMIRYWDFVNDQKVVRGWLSSVRGEYSPTPDPFSVEWEESVYSDEKFWHLVVG